MLSRSLESPIIEDLHEKMVFLGGPRQVGKTTLAKSLVATHFAHAQYLTWDSRDDRRAIFAERFVPGANLLIFDELHKAKGWKTHIKGIFDKHRDSVSILVTGSARLSVYRRGGDSLQGRYHYHVLHPLSVAEMIGRPPVSEPGGILDIPRENTAADGALGDLLRFGGFPEPLSKQNERFWRRWRNERVERVVREDVRDLSSVRDLSLIQLLVDELPRRVGSLLSINALREDLGVAHRSVSTWLNLLDSLYYSYRIAPLAGPRIKSLRKEGKLYLWDWSDIDDPGARLENLVANHLLKFCDFLNYVHGWKTTLHFLRDQEGREVDFAVTSHGRPWFAVEVKSSARAGKHLRYFGERLGFSQLYLVTPEAKTDYVSNGVRTVSLARFLAGLA